MLPEGPLQGVAVFGVRNQDGETSWVGSGFHVIASVDGTGDMQSSFVVLVTNRHVLVALQNAVRANPGCTPVVGVESRDHDAPEIFDFLVDGETVATHPDENVDVAVTFAPLEVIGEIAGVAPVPYEYQYTRAMLLDSGIGEGDNVYVLGFPVNVVAEISHSAVVRKGIIARIRSTHAAGDCKYIIDAGVYPGNSGGPVYVRADGTDAGAWVLAGIVCAYIPYEEVAVSEQTGRARIVFQENSGLAIVHTVDAIHEAIESLLDGASPAALQHFGAFRSDDEDVA